MHTEPPYSFFYRIVIENHSEHSHQLIGRFLLILYITRFVLCSYYIRHWLFECSKGKIEVPKYSSGVIGLQPEIQPGWNFGYMSMTFMDSVPGIMKGSFLMINLVNGEPFDMPVGPLTLNTDD